MKWSQARKVWGGNDASPIKTSGQGLQDLKQSASTGAEWSSTEAQAMTLFSTMPTQGIETQTFTTDATHALCCFQIPLIQISLPLQFTLQLL